MVRFHRALLYAELEEGTKIKKAIEGFEQVRKVRGDHPEAARALAESTTAPPPQKRARRGAPHLY